MWIIFFLNFGHKYDFEVGGVGWVVPVWVWGGPALRKQTLL